MKISAPAKINLSLEIVGKRIDGFHEIKTLVVPITLHDELEISTRVETGIDFVCDEPALPMDDSNLVVRAAKLFCENAHKPANLKIALRKNIPHGAGLGGGSSDAASTLLALDQIFATAFSIETLVGFAAALGSDVPFFIYRSSANCAGRGDRVSPVHFSDQLALLLIKPGFSVATPWAYQHWRDSKELPGIAYQAQEFPWGKLVNDLERPVFEKHIFLGALKTWLLAQTEVRGALMSGSGSTTFAILREEKDGDSLNEKLRARFGPNLWIRTCHTEG